MKEKSVLIVCVITTAFFAFLGLGWGLYASSGMILFDGIYSAVSLVLSLVSLVVLKQIQSPDEDHRFPFGKAHFEPLIIVLKSLIVIGVCSYSGIDAFLVVLEGGRDVALDSALIYAVISTLGCLVIFIFLHIKNKAINSKLLGAEKNQWFGDVLLSLGVFVGFGCAMLLDGTPYAWLIPYADPAMVFLASSAFIILPMQTLILACKEILYYQVSDAHLLPIDIKAKEIAHQLQAEYKLRMSSVGREINIELNFLMQDTSLTICQMDEIRAQLIESSKQINEQHWVNINFTTQKDWL